MTPKQEKIFESLSGLASYEVEQLVDHIAKNYEVFGTADYEEQQEEVDRLLEENASLDRQIFDLEQDIRDYERELLEAQRRIDTLEAQLEQLEQAELPR